MTAARLERRICEALAAALGAAAFDGRRPVVRGAWADAAAGRDGPELNPVGTLAEVSVSPPAYEAYGLGRVRMECSVRLLWRPASAAAAAATVPPACAAAQALLDSWQLGGCGTLASLAFPGFFPAAVLPGGGEPPSRDGDGGAWSARFDFEVRGCVEQPQGE